MAIVLRMNITFKKRLDLKRFGTPVTQKVHHVATTTAARKIAPPIPPIITITTGDFIPR